MKKICAVAVALMMGAVGCSKQSEEQPQASGNAPGVELFRTNDQAGLVVDQKALQTMAEDMTKPVPVKDGTYKVTYVVAKGDPIQCEFGIEAPDGESWIQLDAKYFHLKPKSFFNEGATIRVMDGGKTIESLDTGRGIDYQGPHMRPPEGLRQVSEGVRVQRK
jgi:hypothetical protein